MQLPSLVPVGAWVWDTYAKAVIDRTAEVFRVKWERIKWKNAAEAYRLKIKKLYGSMQIMGMPEPVPLEDIFTDVLVLDLPTAFRRFDIERLQRLAIDSGTLPPTRTNGLKLVAERITRTRSRSNIRLLQEEKGKDIREEDILTETGRNLFILGKPGAGKTTFLKYLALKAAEQILDKVPIFVSLKEWADSQMELLPFIAARFDICDFPAADLFVNELLDAGNAIVLFDGLDEVNQESGQRDEQIRQMNLFFEKYDRTQCLITCRIAATDYSFTPFTYVELADFTPKQVRVFVSNWFRDAEGRKDQKTCRAFLEEFDKEDNKGLRDLAKTPLLLTLLCLAFDEALTFPQRRVELYEEAISALLKKWDSSRRIKRDTVYQKLSLGHKQMMLQRIAAETFEGNQYFIPQSELERLIANYIKNVPPHDKTEAADTEAILKSIEAQHGIFVERARRIYSFSHLTFQEYLTSKYIVDNASQGTLHALVDKHCGDPRWKEVFLLTTSLLPDATDFMGIFRRGLDKLIDDERRLVALLEWVAKKTPLDQDQFHIDLVTSYKRRARMLDQAIDRSRDRTISNALVQALKDTDSAHGYLTPTDFDFIYDRASELGLTEVAEQLDVLSDRLKSPQRFDSEKLANELRSLILTHEAIEQHWRLSEEQDRKIVEYMKTTRLLVDCLQLATMPVQEKTRVLDSLYLPADSHTITLRSVSMHLSNL